MKLKLFLITLAASSLILVSGCGILPEEDERLQPPIKEIEEVTYRTMEVFRSDIEKNLNLFAQWLSEDKVTYSFSEFNAPLLEIRVSEGDEVKPGDILAVLDIGDIDKQLRDMDIAWQRQKLSYERVLERYNAGTASRFDLEIAELDFEDVTNKYNDLKKYKAGSLLVADVEGTVLNIMNYEPGQEVTTGSSILTVAKSDNLILRATSSAIRNEPVEEGHEAILTSGNVTMKGFIKQISGTQVVIEPERMIEGWEIGSTVSVLVPIASATDVLVVDRNAISSIGDRRYVRVLENGIAVEKYITTGLSSGRYVEVVSGLEEGEEVILK